MHDPIRHIQGLRLSLSQDKAPIGLLLAAGCPLAVRASGPPLIPDIAGMTTQLADRLSSGADKDAFARLMACLTEDGVNDPNLEDWLSSVRALRQVAGPSTVRGLTNDELDTLETKITDGVVKLTDQELPPAPTPFHAVAAWAGAVERDTPIEIFTTNYDLLFEQAFESVRQPYFDGFVGVREPFFDNASVAATEGSPLPPRFTRIWKLHGSINWYLSKGSVIRSQLGTGGRRLIHPSHLKYEESRQMPYLALFDRLRGFLSQRGALLVVCGYSFRDRHINALLRDGLQANPTASVIGLVHSSLTKYAAACELARVQTNFGLYGRDSAIIGTREATWDRDPGPPAEVTGVYRNGGWQVRLGDFAELGSLLRGLLDRSRGGE